MRLDGNAVSGSATEFGFSRPLFYQVAAAIDAGGLAAHGAGPSQARRAHKTSAEVVAFAHQQLEPDPALRAADLAGAIEEPLASVCTHARSNGR